MVTRGCCKAGGWPALSSSRNLLMHCPSPLQFQKFLSLSRPSLEYESAALEQPKVLRPLGSSSIAVVGKVSSQAGGAERAASGWCWGNSVPAAAPLPAQLAQVSSPRSDAFAGH